jgi:FlaA1/EpsC-like NDP-sugar epimerase
MNALEIITGNRVFLSNESTYESFRGKKVWITGICGSIGYELCTRLFAGGANVGGIDCNESGIARILSKYPSLTGRVVAGFYQDIIPKKEDFVFHCAAFKHVRLAGYNPKGYEDNNCTHVHRMLEDIYAQERLGYTTRFILVSTDKASGNSVMGRTKKDAEDRVRFYHHHTVRLVNVAYSNGSVLDLWDKGTFKVCSGEVERYWMQLSDAAYVLCRAALLPPDRYTVVNVPLLSMGEMKSGWEKLYGPKEWETFELHDEVEREKLVSDRERLIPVNEYIGRIE